MGEAVPLLRGAADDVFEDLDGWADVGEGGADQGWGGVDEAEGDDEKTTLLFEDGLPAIAAPFEGREVKRDEDEGGEFCDTNDLDADRDEEQTVAAAHVPVYGEEGGDGEGEREPFAGPIDAGGCAEGEGGGRFSAHTANDVEPPLADIYANTHTHTPSRSNTQSDSNTHTNTPGSSDTCAAAVVAAKVIEAQVEAVEADATGICVCARVCVYQRVCVCV